MTCIGVSLPLMMIKPENMVRTDGTKVTLPRHPTWKAEIMGLFYVLRDDPMIAFLFPMFLASNWFTPWGQFPIHQVFQVLSEHISVQ